MYASYTHFRTNWWAIPLFQYHAIRSYRQANQSIGLLGISVWAIDLKNYCTLTTWQSKQHMLTFLGQGAHKKAMQLSHLLGKGYTVGWQTETNPTKVEAVKYLKEKLTTQGLAQWL